MNMVLRLIIIFILSNRIFGDNDGYCSMYRGEVCRNYINGTQFVWYVKPMNGTSKADAHESITNNLWDELIATLKEPCRSVAEVIAILILFTTV